MGIRLGWVPADWESGEGWGNRGRTRSRRFRVASSAIGVRADRGYRGLQKRDRGLDFMNYDLGMRIAGMDRW